MDLAGASNSTSLLQLPTALQLHILSFLSPNDRALSGRLVSPYVADALNAPQHSTAFLSQPLPAHAVPWVMEAGQQHVRRLPFRHKLHLMCTAAASGSEVNLEVALALLQPSIFPESLLTYDSIIWQTTLTHDPDLGVAAVKAGHPQLLGWLLRRCPGWLRPGCALSTAARHCDLAGLQMTWAALKDHYEGSNGGSGSLMDSVGCPQLKLNAAAESATSDAVEKVRWLLATFHGRCRLQESTALVAIRSGDLGRLRWLHSLGCPMGGERIMSSPLSWALEHADLAVAEWLVDEAGCPLPTGRVAGLPWGCLQAAAVRSPDGVEKLAWLRERGAPPPTADLVEEAVRARQAEVASYLLLEMPGAAAGLQTRGDWLLHEAVHKRSIPTVELLWRVGVELTHELYRCVSGSLPMARWLTRHMEVPTVGRGLFWLTVSWPEDTPAHSRDLLEAVQLLVDTAGHCVPPADYKAAVTAAARRGDMALVQYLLQQQQQQRLAAHSCYQPDGELLTAAAEGGCEALLEWLVEQHPGCLSVAGTLQRPYQVAGKHGDRGTLEVLRRLGVPWGTDGVVLRALWAGCPFPVLQWLVEQGASVGNAGDVSMVVERRLARKELDAEAAAWLQGLVFASAR